jgi:hypothetical protein
MSLAAALCLPSTALAQDGALGDEVPPSPIEQLLDQRAALDLSTEQLSHLDELRQRLASQNEPLVNQMMTLRRQWQQARRGARNGRAGADERVEQIRRDAQDARAKIQQNNRAAMQEVNRLLRPAQRRELRGIIQGRRQGARQGNRGEARQENRQEERQGNRGRRAGSGSNAGDRR